jgi:hypothetical protein
MPVALPDGAAHLGRDLGGNRLARKLDSGSHRPMRSPITDEGCRR